MSNLIAESAAKAQTPQPAPLPKKFYALATYEAGLKLDGRPAKTPAKNALIAPSQAIGEALAFEWNAQEAVINPAKMPLTRLLNSIIDGVLPNPMPTRDEIIKYAASDLICYRSSEPEELVALQAACWDAPLSLLREKLNAPFVLSASLKFVEQPVHSLVNFAAALPIDGYKIGAMNVITTLSGSALLTLCLYKGWLTPKQFWQAVHVDEDFQISHWGEDEDEKIRRIARFKDFESATLVLNGDI